MSKTGWLKNCIVLFLMTTLLGCGKEEVVVENGMQIYHLNFAETRVEAGIQEVTGTTVDQQVYELLGYLQSGSATEKAPLNMGFSILNWHIEDTVLILNLSEEYRSLSGTTEVLVRAAIVRTMLQIQDLTGVSFLVNGVALTDNLGETVGLMDRDTFIQNDGNEINTYELVKVKLYFTNEEADKLLAANREKHYSTNTPLERFVVEELIAGPSGQVEGLYPTMNPDTKVINVMTTEGICYVNLDSNFMNVINNTSLELEAHSIANSLLELNNINKVQILVNGEVPEVFQGTFFTREEVSQ